MQYQIFNKKSRTVVAWIESNASINNFIIHDDYEVKSGNQLKVRGYVKDVKVEE